MGSGRGEGCREGGGEGGAKKRGAMVRMMSVMKGEPCIGGLGNTDGESGQGQRTQGGSRGKGQVTMQGGRGPCIVRVGGRKGAETAEGEKDKGRGFHNTKGSETMTEGGNENW